MKRRRRYCFIKEDEDFFRNFGEEEEFWIFVFDFCLYSGTRKCFCFVEFCVVLLFERDFFKNFKLWNDPKWRFSEGLDFEDFFVKCFAICYRFVRYSNKRGKREKLFSEILLKLSLFDFFMDDSKICWRKEEEKKRRKRKKERKKSLQRKWFHICLKKKKKGEKREFVINFGHNWK